MSINESSSSTNTTAETKKRKTAQTSNLSEQSKIETDIDSIFIRFHAFVAPEVKVDIEKHRFGIVSSHTNWKQIKPLEIIS